MRCTRWFGSLSVAVGLVGLGGCPANNSGNAGEPLLTITAQDHVLGNPAARITVIEYGDFQCPVCGAFFAQTYPTIKADFIDTGKVRWVFRQFPLRQYHPRAEAAARASECAAQQGKFFEYGDLLFANQLALSDDDLRAYAAQAGLDLAQFDACLASGETAAAVQEDVDSGLALGVSATPTFFINGTRVAGFRTATQFAALLDPALSDD